ncbi:RNA polymerase sigma factor [Thalassotalea montiporae]
MKASNWTIKPEQSEAEIAAQLVAQIINGNSEAETAMVSRYQRGLLFMLRHRSKNAALAEDISQETWRLVIEKVRAGELKNPDKLASFIVQIGKNQLLMHYRKQQPHQQSEDRPPLHETAEVQEQDHPQHILEKHNNALLVRQLINEMPTHRDKELILRFYLHEQEKQAICQELDLSVSHFNRVLFRARQRFKALWQKHMGKNNSHPKVFDSS